MSLIAAIKHRLNVFALTHATSFNGEELFRSTNEKLETCLCGKKDRQKVRQNSRDVKTWSLREKIVRKKLWNNSTDLDLDTKLQIVNGKRI